MQASWHLTGCCHDLIDPDASFPLFLPSLFLISLSLCSAMPVAVSLSTLLEFHL